MATVTFNQLWLNSVADPTDAMAFSVNSIEHDPTVDVDNRPRAAGNIQSVRTLTKQKIAKVALNFCTDIQTAWLKAHQGEMLCYRDPTGEKFYGNYADSTFAPRLMGNSWVVPLTFAEATQTEAV